MLWRILSVLKNLKRVGFAVLFLLGANQITQGQWSVPQQLEGGIDSVARAMHWPSINSIGDTLYYSNYGPGANQNVYKSYRYGENLWSAPIELPPSINTAQRELSPSIGPGDSTLYFVSYGRARGYGDYDIWFSRRGANGQWLPAENPGPNINSDGMEWGVFLSRDGQHLYFSSTRSPQGTGLDIFVSSMTDSGWGEAVQLEGGVNSFRFEENVTLPADESFLVLTLERVTTTRYDLFRSEQVNGVWSELTSMTDFNTEHDEYGASLSPDGYAIYFASERNDTAGGASQLFVSHWTDAVGEEVNLPIEFSLSAYPNPFNSSTDILFEMPRAAHATIKVYDVLGREQARLLDDVVQGGARSVMWNAEGFASGIYFVRLSVGDVAVTRKVALVK